MKYNVSTVTHLIALGKFVLKLDYSD